MTNYALVRMNSEGVCPVSCWKIRLKYDWLEKPTSIATWVIENCPLSNNRFACWMR